MSEIGIWNPLLPSIGKEDSILLRISSQGRTIILQDMYALESYNKILQKQRKISFSLDIHHPIHTI